MATRPGPTKRNQSEPELEANKWISGGGVTNQGKYKRIIDPAGVGDAWFGGEFMAPDTRAIDAENEAALQGLESSLPKNYRKVEYQGDFAAPEQERSAMSGVEADPRLKQYQLAAMQALQEQSSEGLTLQDRANRARLDNDVNRQNAGRIGAIEQQYAARGGMGSGLGLTAQMMNAQAGTERQAQSALDTAAAGEAQKRAAISNLGAMSGQVRGQDFNEQESKAQASDAINRFNAANKAQAGMRNADTRQTMANVNAIEGNRFDQLGFDKRAQAVDRRINYNTNMGNEAKYNYNSAIDSNEKRKSGILDTAGKVIGAVGGMMSDERVKHDVSHLSDDDIEEFLRSIMPKKYRYNDESMGEGQRVGVIAQDLERSKVGRDLVKEGPEGKQLDINNTIGALLDAVAHLNRKVG